jgi:hypothetical protein
MGNVVPGGGAEISGVFVLVESVLLQAANSSRLHRTTANFRAQRRKDAKDSLGKTFAPLRLCVSSLSFDVILYCGSLILFLGERFTGDSIFTFNPPAEINQLTPL